MDLITGLIRTGMDIIVAMIFFMMANFYFQANERRKRKSKIITWNVNLLVSLAVFFTFLSALPIIRDFSLKTYLFCTRHFYVVTLPVLISAWYLWKKIMDD